MKERYTKAMVTARRTALLMPIIMWLFMGMTFSSCEDDVPENIKDELVGAWTLPMQLDAPIMGSYIFEADGTGYFYIYMTYTYYNWTYNPDTKEIKMLLEGSDQLFGRWKIVKFSGDHMTVEDLDWRAEDGDSEDPYFRLDRIKDWVKPN